MPDVDQDQRDKVLLEELAIEAGKIGMRWLGKKPEVWMKPGDSPVSEADFAIDRFLRNELLLARPDYLLPCHWRLLFAGFQMTPQQIPA